MSFHDFHSSFYHVNSGKTNEVFKWQEYLSFPIKKNDLDTESCFYLSCLLICVSFLGCFFLWDTHIVLGKETPPLSKEVVHVVQTKPISESVPQTKLRDR